MVMLDDQALLEIKDDSEFQHFFDLVFYHCLWTLKLQNVLVSFVFILHSYTTGAILGDWTFKVI